MLLVVAICLLNSVIVVVYFCGGGVYFCGQLILSGS